MKTLAIIFSKNFFNDLPRILLVSALGTIFIICVVNSQQTIYVWDSLQTWEPTLYCEETIFTDPYQALKNLIASINHADYNNFLPILMALPMHLFGRSFFCYVLYVWLMFGLPGIFFASATFKTILEKAGFKEIPCSAFMAIFMILPITAIPIFVGYANISILLPSSILLAMLLRLDRVQLQRDRLAMIAALCVFAVFQARTAAYMILGIFFGYTLYVAIPVRHDIEDLKKFLNELNELTTRTDKRVYFLASSGEYNSAVLSCIYLPEKHNALQNLIGTKDIDLRDGFPIDFFDADYVVVTDPIQTHLRWQDQLTVVGLSEGVTHIQQLSRHFKQIKEYAFSYNENSTVKFKLYEKISPYEKADIDFVESFFVETYPNQPELFKNRFEEYKREHFKE